MTTMAGKNGRIGQLLGDTLRAPSVHVRQLTVTPAMAEEWLKSNSNNRSISKKRVEYLAEQIKDGNWSLTHQGIAFWDDGTLADGQHRLLAIVKAGIAVPVLVTTGMAKPAIHAIDMVRPRSTRDVLNFVGLRMSTHDVSAAKVMYMQRQMDRDGLTSWSCVPIPTEKFTTFLSFAMPSIEFAAPLSKTKGLSHSCLQAALASAWFTQDRARLERFRSLVASGVDAANDESAAIRLRDFLMTSPLTAGGHASRQQVFQRCCTALRAFLEGRGLSKLYCRTDAAFPIPDGE